ALAANTFRLPDALPIWQVSVTTIVNTRFDKHDLPPSTYVTFVEAKLQLSLACTRANTSALPGILAGLQPSGVVPEGALIPGGVVTASPQVCTPLADRSS